MAEFLAGTRRSSSSGVAAAQGMLLFLAGSSRLIAADASASITSANESHVRHTTTSTATAQPAKAKPTNDAAYSPPRPRALSMADFRSSVSNQPSGGADGGIDGLEETLGRLAKKPGVKATIVLDRTSGAILKTSGEISSIRTSRSDPLVSSSFSSENGSSSAGEPQGAEQLAAMVWNFISAAGSLVRDLDSEDELRLLRLRTKNQELVIVPDPKYLLIVIHDTPAA